MSGPTLGRRSAIAAGASAAATALLPANAHASPAGAFPQGFLWGAATAGHQAEGNNIASDVWLLENIRPNLFAERSGDACNSLELWPVDLDLVRSLDLNS